MEHEAQQALDDLAANIRELPPFDTEVQGDVFHSAMCVVSVLVRSIASIADSQKHLADVAHAAPLTAEPASGAAEVLSTVPPVRPTLESEIEDLLAKHWDDRRRLGCIEDLEAAIRFLRTGDIPGMPF